LIYKTIALTVLLLAGQIIIPSYAVTAGEILTPRESPFQHEFVDVKILDAYFGTVGQKIEVEPGDQNIPFTVVLTNAGSVDISGIKGTLSLPAGFSGTDSATNGLILADNTQSAPSGESFGLTFFVNLDKSLGTHEYSGTIKVTYTRVRETGERSTFIDFNYKVTGKSILTIKAVNPVLQPASNNDVAIQISNPGSAPINNVQVSVLPTGNNTSGIVVDQNHWNVGSVKAGSSNTFSFKAFIPQSIAGQVLHPQFLITYFDGQGNQISTTKIVDFIVAPVTSSIIGISSPAYLMMGVLQNMTIQIENLSPSKISNVGITITPSSDGLKILKDNKWFVGEINPFESATLNIPVFADKSMEGQAVNYVVNMQYTKDGSTIIEKQNFANYIRGVIDISVHDIGVSEIAGKKMIIGNVLNQGNVKAVFGQVTVIPLDNSIIKQSSQYIGDIDIDAPVPFNIPINSDTPPVGDQKVQVTLTWKDTLLQQHTITEVDTVSFGTPTVSNDNSNSSQLQIIILVAIAAGIGGIVFKIRKKKIPLEKKVQESS
jgi:uncharacterized repeat protein (TIGR01451 family)